MARPVWSGSPTFGLVTLPVRLYTATDSHTLHFHHGGEGRKAPYAALRPGRAQQVGAP